MRQCAADFDANVHHTVGILLSHTSGVLPIMQVRILVPHRSTRKQSSVRFDQVNHAIHDFRFQACRGENIRSLILNTRGDRPGPINDSLFVEADPIGDFCSVKYRNEATSAWAQRRISAICEAVLRASRNSFSRGHRRFRVPCCRRLVRGSHRQRRLRRAGEGTTFRFRPVLPDISALVESPWPGSNLRCECDESHQNRRRLHGQTVWSRSCAGLGRQGLALQLRQARYDGQEADRPVRAPQRQLCETVAA